MVVEPARVIFGDAGRQDLGLPGAGRRREPFELAEHRGERVGALHAGLFGDPLPVEQEAQEVARGDRLDFGAQPVQRIAVNAGEEPALAPFFGVRTFDIRAGCEAAAQREAFLLQRRQRTGDAGRRQPERLGKRCLAHRAEAFEPAAHDLDERLFR